MTVEKERKLEAEKKEGNRGEEREREKKIDLSSILYSWFY